MVAAALRLALSLSKRSLRGTRESDPDEKSQPRTRRSKKRFGVVPNAAERLRSMDERKFRALEMSLFGRLKQPEIAEVLDGCRKASKVVLRSHRRPRRTLPPGRKAGGDGLDPPARQANRGLGTPEMSVPNPFAIIEYAPASLDRTFRHVQDRDSAWPG